MITAELGGHLETVVARLVESGRFASESEVLREGVRMIEDREVGLLALDDALERGLADAASGRTRDADVVFDRLDAKYRAMISTAT